jgi:hypothetical protein
MTASGHSLPTHTTPVPTNVRYAPNSDQNVASRRMTLSAISGLMHRSKFEEIRRDKSAIRDMTQMVSCRLP